MKPFGTVSLFVGDCIHDLASLFRVDGGTKSTLQGAGKHWSASWLASLARSLVRKQRTCEVWREISVWLFWFTIFWQPGSLDDSNHLMASSLSHRAHRGLGLMNRLRSTA